jgi:hypothetical protein
MSEREIKFAALCPGICGVVKEAETKVFINQGGRCIAAIEKGQCPGYCDEPTERKASEILGKARALVDKKTT